MKKNHSCIAVAGCWCHCCTNM